MTTPNQLRVKELEANGEAYQLFDGTVEQVSIPQGMDVLQVPMLTVDLSKGEGELGPQFPSITYHNHLIISGDQPSNPALPKLGDEQVLAELELGGVEADSNAPRLPSQKVYLIKVTDQSSPLILDSAGGQKELEETQKYGIDLFALVAFDASGIGGEEHITAVAPIDHATGLGLVGRNSNLMWCTPRSGRLIDAGQSPFGDNQSISRQQFYIGRQRDRSQPGRWPEPLNAVLITNLTKNSKTIVKTRATEQHLEVVAANEKAAEDAQQKADAAKKAGKVSLKNLLKRK